MEKMGQPPVKYLTDCRMRRACSLLREQRCALKEIAGRTGYDSESAFSNAFKRWSGRSPGEWRKLQTVMPAPPPLGPQHPPFQQETASLLANDTA